MKIDKEDTSSDFEGTIIDLETTGAFDQRFNDSRRYANIRPVLFGFITNSGLEIHCAENDIDMKKLHEKISGILVDLQRPFYSFNAHFEMGVLSHTLKKEVVFDCELNSEKYEAKKYAVANLRLSNYDDPFFDNGLLCHASWKSGKIDSIIRHNRADLLKERDILLKRGFRKPDAFSFVGL